MTFRYPLLFAGLTMMLSMAPGSTPAHAACPGIVADGETQTTTQTLANGESCSVEQGGTITTTPDVEHAILGAGSNTITIDGTISTQGDRASGIAATDDNMITNDGAISTSGGRSNGIAAGNDNIITNDGTISTSGGTAFGIGIDNNNIITNNGTITTSESTANGIGGINNNTITNNGAISTTNFRSHGIVVENNNTITNDGTISTFGQNAVGIRADINNIVTNNGTISTDGVGANGIQVDTDSSAINNGTIIITSGNGMGAKNNSSVINNGTILVTIGQGIRVDQDNLVVNNGTISTFGSGNSAINAEDGNTIINSGFINAANPDAFAIYFEGGSNSLTLLPGSVLVGKIQVSGNTDTLNVGNGLSVATTFTGGVPSVGTTNGAPFATSGLQIVVVDPTNLSTQDEQLADLTGGITSALENRLSGVRNGAAGSVTTSGPYDAPAASDPGHPFWMQGFGSYRQQEASSPAVETQQWIGGFVIGADDLLQDNLRVGFLGGAAWGGVEADFDSQETDSQSFFVGSYASLLKAGLIFDLALTAGYSDFDQERSVANNLAAGGLETATADFSGWFVSPELTVTKPTVLLGRRLETSLALRYAGLFLDGYTESGTTAPLTVDDRDVHIGVARLQLAAPYENIFADGSAFRYRLKAGIEARTNFGGETIDGALLGQNISFNPGGDDNTLGGYLGLSGEYDTGGGLVLTAGTEGLVETTGSYQFSGRAGVKFRF